MTGRRDLKVRVKTAKKRRNSSTRWLERQLNDPYVHEANRLGYRSRAAFKLKEIDEKHRLLKPGMVVVDLGAAPGGWCQVAGKIVGAETGNGTVIAIDLKPIDAIAGVTALVMDFMDDEAPGALIKELGGKKADIVLSDMAASASGHKATDHMRIMALLECAVDFATDVLAPGGTFLGKVLKGGTEAELLKILKRDFTNVKHVKPNASRADSAETYVLATGFRGSIQPS